MPAIGFGVIWLLLRQAWAVLAVLAALAVLCAVTRTAMTDFDAGSPAVRLATGAVDAAPR